MGDKDLNNYTKHKSNLVKQSKYINQNLKFYFEDDIIDVEKY